MRSVVPPIVCAVSLAIRWDQTSKTSLENYLRETVELFGWEKEQRARLIEQYELEMDFESIPELSERFGLSFAEG